MKFLVFGSLNIDKVYTLEHLPATGQTLTCSKYEIHVGGKGLNQAVSLSKAGGDVYMAGAIVPDGAFLEDFLKAAGADTSLLLKTDGYTGHAVIEVDSRGQNQMILFAGANREIPASYCDSVLENLSEGDLVVMQYETSQVEYMIEKSHEKGVKVALNPSPFTDVLKNFDYSCVDYLILNEEEGQNITGESESEKITQKLLEKLCGGCVILTLGGDGAVYADKNTFVKVPAFSVNAVDTTGAGDTFTGYCLTSLLEGVAPEQALTFASAASAIVVTKPGAAETIPEKAEVDAFLAKHKNC